MSGKKYETKNNATDLLCLGVGKKRYLAFFYYVNNRV